MGVKKHLRTTLFATALLLPLLGQVEASSSTSVVFSQCIDSCIGFSDCGISRPKCMCKASRGSFLDNVLVCMFFHCTSELPNAESQFLVPMELGCASINKPIPEDSIEQAEGVLKTLLGRLSGTPTSTIDDSPRSTPARQQTRTTESKSKPTEASASTSSVDGVANTSAATDSPAPTTLTEVGDSATQTIIQSSTSVNPAPNTDPTDSSPFATPGNAAGRSVGSYLWAGLPMAIAIALR